MTVSQLEAKGFQPELKLAASGEVQSVIATLNVIDKDRDVTLPGFFGEQTVGLLIAHDWGRIPVGKGRIYEQDEEAIFDGKLNLKDPNGSTAYEWLNFDLSNGEPIQEWSYGFMLQKGGFRFGEHEGEEVRFLVPREDGSPGGKINEVSMVIVGAGEGTRTLAVKEASQLPADGAYLVSDGRWNPLGSDEPGLKFSEHTETTLAVVAEFGKRARSLADLRAKEGRPLSGDYLEKIRALRDELGAVLEIGPETIPDLPSDESFELMLAQTEARIHGRMIP